MHKASRSAKGAVLNASGMPRSSALSTFVRAPTEAVPLVFPRRRQLPLKACTNLANEIGGRRQLGFVERRLRQGLLVAQSQPFTGVHRVSNGTKLEPRARTPLWFGVPLGQDVVDDAIVELMAILR